MSSNSTNPSEVDRVSRLISRTLFDLFGDVTAPETPARLVSILTQEPPSLSLSLAFAEAVIGFAECFADLLHALIRCLKTTLSYDLVKKLQIDDTDQGSQSFISLLEHDLPAALKVAYRSGALRFDLKSEDGSLNPNNPCFSAGLFSAVAILQRFAFAGQYHRVVSLCALKIVGTVNTSDIEEKKDAMEAYVIATLICFAMVGAHKYAQVLAEDGVTYEMVCEGVEGLKRSGVVRHTATIALLDVSRFPEI